MRLTNENILAAFKEAAALQSAGAFPASAALWRQIVAAAPTSAEAWRNFGDVLTALSQFAEAEAAYRQAFERKPDAVWSLWGLAGFLHKTGRWREAEPLYAQALAITPDDSNLRLAYGHLRLGLGDFAAGWPLYESRVGLPGQGADAPPLRNEWRGEPVAGRRLLIWPEQGFGDQIQFARYALALQAAGAEVVLVCPPELHALFAELPVKVIAGAQTLTLDEPDYWTLALSAPGRLGVILADVTGAAYLRAPADRRAKWARHVAPGSIGVAWRGRMTHPNDAHRSLPAVEALEPLRRTGANLVDLTEPVGDFADLAAIIEQLDLVVTVDTAVGHLAGALGKPCWILLPCFRQDWRWLQDRTDSPWYDSVRLFRQTAPGDWGPVLASVADTLEARR
ncbi:tetratricopeptide repeat-containing glycosyltransferase family protein [Phenylobacterium sp.]|jgi:tetratricopeptide (TPR) repeat protein|uniref:tetratricopeptide repeat-containing glycosyltransferase family protein n=1 Tax=Phenylobacterium sp. TaxID=1871053 RepID=UPI002E2F5A80|nr:tetratricopeptide repeat-containing glycosyltransferase family protein [Phenylobacterium sp.]HEX4711862.1 tetratricopeptide repeat-containing glycosyltransferase family protein [Phenylobacterium sp.]